MSPWPATSTRRPGSRGEHRRQRLEQHGQALARFVDAGRGRPRSARPGCPASADRWRAREPVDEHPVRDDDRVAADVRDHGLPRGLRDGDPPVDLLQRRPDQRVGGLHGPRAHEARVEGRDDRPLGGPQREDRHARRDRFVDVDDVERARLQPAADPGRGDAVRTSAARPSRCTCTGIALPEETTYGGTDAVLVGRRQHADVVPGGDEVLGEVTDVELHAAGDVERVRADDADPHARRLTLRPGLRRLGDANRRRPAASCASPRCARRSRAPSTSTQAWVIAATRSAWRRRQVPGPRPGRER